MIEKKELKAGITEEEYFAHLNEQKEQLIKEGYAHWDLESRGTGRTNRIILKAAFDISKHPGKPVVLEAHSLFMAKEMASRLLSVLDVLRIPKPKTFCLSGGALPHEQAQCLVFKDHPV
ncbi:hypothetical protein [Maridesulfovibrio sp.]|uniref:hypothetical protein n=1 Tax=Maridesulfovibrio sp. TaxID=2795000 RepID=UPI002AA7AB99|nr:hypothetical protein [Maridesulfovibrio sp.]